MICEICGKIQKNYLGLTTHIRFIHKEFSVKDYYDHFFKQENENKCSLDGCINKTRFQNIHLGYCKFCCKEHSSKSESWKIQVKTKWLNKDSKIKENIIKKRHNTIVKKYGSIKYIIDRMLLSLGVDNCSQLPYVKEKIKQSWNTKTKEEIDNIITKRKSSCMKKYGVEHNMYIPRIASLVGSKSRDTREKLGHFLPKSQMSLFKLYYNQVYNLTTQNVKKCFTKEILKTLGRCGSKNGKQIDHMFSIKQGFINNILPCIIASQENLRIIDWKENDKKKDQCTITKEQLFQMIDSKKILLESEAGIKD